MTISPMMVWMKVTVVQGDGKHSHYSVAEGDALQDSQILRWAKSSPPPLHIMSNQLIPKPMRKSRMVRLAIFL